MYKDGLVVKELNETVGSVQLLSELGEEEPEDMQEPSTTWSPGF